MFDGFSEQAIDFLWGIRMNNEKPWFEEHKQEYRAELLQPMKALAAECYDELHRKYPDRDMLCRVSRIYRDARRLFGRGPYKDHMWFGIEMPSEDHSGTPTFWFEITPEGWSYGLGYWMPKPATMAKLRARISRDPKTFRRLVSVAEGKTELVLCGQEYKKPKGKAPSADLERWFRVKSFAWEYDGRVEELVGKKDLPERLMAGYEQMIPWFDYLCTLDGDPDPKEAAT